MFNYSYKARDDYGKIVRGVMLAEDETDLANKISNLGYFLIKSKVIIASSKVATKFPSLNQKDVLNFTIHLSTLFGAGVSLLDALRDLARDEKQDNIQRIIDDIRYRVESGTTLKEALSFHPKTFSKLYTAIIGAGEKTGKLASCLSDLAALLDWQMEIQAKVKEAATYPIILFTVMIGVVTLLVVKVIPTFATIFDSANVVLPLPTQIVLGVSYSVRHYWYMIVSFVFLMVILYKICYANPKGKYKIDSLKLKLPLFGLLLRKVTLSRFCHTFGLALKSGIDVLTALDMGIEVIGNSRLEYVVKKARDSINIGEKLGGSLAVSGEFPTLVIRMIDVGEQSGSLVECLEKVNQFYDREVPTTIRKLFVLLEPMMIVFMGVVVGGIALSIFLPLFQIAQLAGG